MKRVRNFVLTSLLSLGIGLSIHAGKLRDLPVREWNFTVCMANNNNLHRYGVQNFRQMLQVGSTPFMNVVLQMDEYGAKQCNRFYLERNNPVIIENLSGDDASFSGTSQNFVSLAQCVLSNYPANNQIMVLWNHGAGIKDPDIWGRVLSKWRDEFFIFNSKSGLLELNRDFKKDKKWLNRMNRLNKQRGIAFNEVAETYLTNQDLKNSLEYVNNTMLGGTKIAILAMDACHMAMVEVASQIKTAVNIMVASQETEPGAGYNYASILSPFLTQSLSPAQLATHLVDCYDREYRGVLGDYTHSAIDLTRMPDLEIVLNNLSLRLLDLVNVNSGLRSVREIRYDSTLVTEFLDNDYIDLGHLLRTFVDKGALYARDPYIGSLWSSVATAAYESLRVLESMIIANCRGPRLPQASGLSIYFPIQTIHASYYSTDFAMVTQWTQFLEKFIGLRQVTKGESKHSLMQKEKSNKPKTKACCDECADNKPCASEKDKKHDHGHDHAHKHDHKEDANKKEPCCKECAEHKPCASEKKAEKPVVKEEKKAESKPARPKPTGCVPCQKRKK